MQHVCSKETLHGCRHAPPAPLAAYCLISIRAGQPPMDKQSKIWDDGWWDEASVRERVVLWVVSVLGEDDTGGNSLFWLACVHMHGMVGVGMKGGSKGARGVLKRCPSMYKVHMSLNMINACLARATTNTEHGLSTSRQKGLEVQTRYKKFHSRTFAGTEQDAGLSSTSFAVSPVQWQSFVGRAKDIHLQMLPTPTDFLPHTPIPDLRPFP
eukprot:1160588-Pelagomonas_calceolata.AAC.9